MLPSIVAREVQAGLKRFLRTTFPMTTPGFMHGPEKSTLDAFLEQEHALFKGPWLEVKLPFRRAPLGQPLPFTHITLGFQPYRHQQVAFGRLCQLKPASSIVATGTGSGKTECFMYPLLDYCLRERRQGIKAIIIYPMNALATDQARRFAKEVNKLDTKLSVGLFTGDDGSQNRRMTPEQVITHRDTLRESPPDILLTNYKMLDFLLMRPKDQRLWRHNTPGLLRYLVVDELHTFDGAQGTDLACLVRRLRDKLKIGDELACVGTSATIGDDSGVDALCAYAADVFATPFEREAIILEDRLSVSEYLDDPGNDRGEVLSRWPRDNLRELEPGRREQGVYLRQLAQLWLGADLALDDRNALRQQQACVELGQLLLRHTAFEALLQAAHKVCDMRVLAADWQRRFNLAVNLEQVMLLIDSLCALISAARIWVDPQQPSKGVQPFLQVRVQLWLRELRRMVASVEAMPILRHHDDLQNPQSPLHLPVLHCRECHATAWGAIRPEGEQSIRADLQSFYSAWFSHRPDACLIFPLPQEAPRPQEGDRQFCSSCLTLHAQPGECPDCQRPMMRVWLPNLLKQRTVKGEARVEASNDCPCCQGKAALSILGSRAASLASVAIGDLYGSDYNDDYRLIAFSDSVQDAAHRAGFFGARTYSQVVRHAIAGVLREQGDGMALSRLIDEVPSYWRRELTRAEDFVGTFIAPNMEWLADYQTLTTEGQLPKGSDLVDLVAQRLRWETLVEFGLRSRIGRTLERSAVATAQVELSALKATADRLTRLLREEVGTLRDIGESQVLTFLLGLMRRLRQAGAFYDEQLDGYVKGRGNTFLLTQRLHLPGYGPLNQPPAALSLGFVSQYFETLFSKSSGWYLGWFNKCLAVDQPLATAEYEQAYRFTLQLLESDGWLKRLDAGQDPAWLLLPQRWSMTARLAEMACDDCGHRQMVAAEQFQQWQGIPCMRHGCAGHYRFQAMPNGDQAYRARPRRLVASEHTGLLDGKRRLEIETSFMRGADCHSWDINLLSATPTLEMGINIGDLSTVLLCSIPPAQANYLQRIGRAGRTDGNALAMAIANGQNHDNYFYEQPLEMLAGSVATPGVFLRAMAVLERQMIAWCFDRWADTGVDESAIPGRMQSVLDTIQAGRQDAFPHNLLTFIEQHADRLLAGFLVLFPHLDADEREHLGSFLLGDRQRHGSLGWRILDRLNELKEERGSLRKRIDALKKQIEQLEKQPEDEERNLLLQGCKEERGALLTLIARMNNRLTLNFFTDEGLLPNYAFPEEGVILKSVILRRKQLREQPAAEGESNKGRFEVLNLEFQRSAEAALGELAPENSFYAAAHQLNIEQVDLNLSKPETWRLCNQCHYAENVTEAQSSHSVCPKCGSPQWADIGQQRSLLRLRQVYARADSRYDRIGDDADQREPTFYQRQLLVDIPDQSVTAAYRLDSDSLPFGFEFLSRTKLREINFGQRGGEAEGFAVAGQIESRRGFRICGKCGMVKRDRLRRGQFAHALDCPYARSGVDEREVEWIDSLYLYRELNSEAIRILLPLADVAYSEVARHSFIAALNMGLKTFFKGDVNHLRITEMLEPAGEGGSARQYLVLYDSIPGGSGYLKELMREPGRLLEMLRQALARLTRCVCVDDEHRDGCYRCLLAYRDSRNMPKISRKTAAHLLEQILERSDSLVSVEGLSQISTANSLVESPLEKRFIEAMDRRFGLEKRTVNGKAGYWFKAGERQWELELQVDFGPAQGIVLPTRADFVIRPARESERAPQNEWLIYTDGFAPHHTNLLDDTRKRQALVMAGRQVLVLAWDDLPEAGKAPPVPASDLLAAGRQVSMLQLFEQLAKQHGWQSSAMLSGFCGLGSYRWLEKWLLDPQTTQVFLQQAAMMTLVGWLDPHVGKGARWEACRTELQALLPGPLFAVLSESPGAVGGLLNSQNHCLGPVNSLARVPLAAMSSLTRLLEEAEVHLFIDDLQAAQTNEFNRQWRAFWQAFNLLQFAPRFSVSCRTGVAQHGYDSALLHWPRRGQPEGAAATEPMDDWAQVFSDCFIDPLSLERLRESGVPVPEVGLDLTEGDTTVATAELSWPTHKLALFTEPEHELPVLSDWVCLSTQTDTWLEQVTSQLSKEQA